MHVVRKLTRPGTSRTSPAAACAIGCWALRPPTTTSPPSARPEQVAALFRRVREVGQAFGVMLVRIARARDSGRHVPHRWRVLRRPASRFGDVHRRRARCRRRDFTINGLFEDPLTDDIIDYVGRPGRSRGAHSARDRRSVRSRCARIACACCARCASRRSFGLAIDPDTADAIRRSRAVGGREPRAHRSRSPPHAQRRESRRGRWEMQYLGLDAPVLQKPIGLTGPDARRPTARAGGVSDGSRGMAAGSARGRGG